MGCQHARRIARRSFSNEFRRTDYICNLKSMYLWSENSMCRSVETSNPSLRLPPRRDLWEGVQSWGLLVSAGARADCSPWMGDPLGAVIWRLAPAGSVTCAIGGVWVAPVAVVSRPMPPGSAHRLRCPQAISAAVIGAQLSRRRLESVPSPS